ncbi:Extracellular Matrix Protein Fras1 [Manis pentadactyla]|nr:Extracellular Matrix Protein Fras1 [Manis pentadactyla]
MSAEILTEDCPGGAGPTGQPGPPHHAPLLFSYQQNLDLLQPCLGIWLLKPMHFLPGLREDRTISCFLHMDLESVATL